MSNTDRCCGGPNGRHMGGCGGGGGSARETRRRKAQADALQTDQQKRDEAANKKADAFIARHYRSDTYTPRPFPGVKMVKGDDGYYYYERA